MNKEINSSPSKPSALSPKLTFVFFGSSDISITVLDVLKEKGFLPTLIVTKPDAKKGRGLEIQKSPVKIWGEKNDIEVLDPVSLNDPEFYSQLSTYHLPLAILVSYGKIIPKSIIDIFPKGILNVHPSLLPLLRGPSPIETTILKDMKNDVGVSVMLLDEKMDEGPVVAQKKIEISDWPVSKSYLYEILGKAGGELLTEVLPDWSEGIIKAHPQDDSKATYSEKIKKTDGLIDLEANTYQNYLKISAFEGWPGTYFFVKSGEKELRVKITEVRYQDEILEIQKVIPEGKKEMGYQIFLQNQKN